MFQKYLFQVIIAVWCCVPDEAVRWDRSWPLHKALVDADADYAMHGFGQLLPDDSRPALCDQAGLGVPQLRSVLVDLVRDGFAEIDAHRCVRLTSQGRAEGAALLMRSPAEAASVFQKAARSWAILSSTSEKNLAAAL